MKPRKRAPDTAKGDFYSGYTGGIDLVSAEGTPKKGKGKPGRFVVGGPLPGSTRTPDPPALEAPASSDVQTPELDLTGVEEQATTKRPGFPFPF